MMELVQVMETIFTGHLCGVGIPVAKCRKSHPQKKMHLTVASAELLKLFEVYFALTVRTARLLHVEFLSRVSTARCI